MIRAARGLLLSTAAHVVALGAGVWIAREVGEPALLVDLTLTERATEPSGAGRAPRPSARPGAESAPIASGARGGSSARQRPSAQGLPSAPPVPNAPPVSSAPAPPAASVASPAPPPPAAVAPAPIKTSPAALDRPATAEPAPAVEPPAAAPSAPVAAGSDARTAESAGGGESSSESASHSAPGGPRSRGGTDATSGARASSGTAGAGGDAASALAVPSDGGVGAYGAYLALLRGRLHELLEYPPAARRRGLTGTVHLEIALEPSGRVSDVMLVRSSAHDLLDRAALEAARSLRRVPFPPDVRPRALRVRLPVVFELR